MNSQFVRRSPGVATLVGESILRRRVEDGVDDFAGRELALDGGQEADELLMPVTLHASADGLAFEHVEDGEQGGRASKDSYSASIH